MAGLAETLAPGLARGAGYLSEEKLQQMAQIRALRVAREQPDTGN